MVIVKHDSVLTRNTQKGAGCFSRVGAFYGILLKRSSEYGFETAEEFVGYFAADYQRWQQTQGVGARYTGKHVLLLQELQQVNSRLWNCVMVIKKDMLEKVLPRQ